MMYQYLHLTLHPHSGLTIESGVHPANIHQEAYHSHTNGTILVLQQLLLQDLATFTALRHGIDVDIGESVTFCSIAGLGEAFGLVFKHQLEEVVLYIFTPEWNTILFLEMSYFVARVD